MADLQVSWNNLLGTGDICVVGQDLGVDETLQTAVLLSLFTDRRVDAGRAAGRRDVAAGGGGGDLLAEEPEQSGSKLWLLRRATATQETLVKAQDYAREALAWMVADGVATGVDVTTEYTPERFLLMRVTIDTPDQATQEFEFMDAGGG